MYYGWKIVIALFISLSFSAGLGFYNHAVLLQALATENGFELTKISIAVSLFFFSGGIAGLFISKWIEKYDIRIVVAAGALIASLSLAFIGLAKEIWQIYFLYLIFGVGFVGSGLLPATTLITRWFHGRRALALSIATTGLSFGGIVVTPASAMLIENIGISASTPILALAYFLGVVPLSVLILRSKPSDINLIPEGTDANTSETSSDFGTPYAIAIRDSGFWGLSIAWVFVMLAQVGGIAHQYGLVGEYLEGNDAAIALGVLPLFSIIGRVIGGFLIDKMSSKTFSLIIMILQMLAFIIMGMSSSPYNLILGLALFGITVGNLLMLQPLLIAEHWGLQSFSRIYASSNLLTMVGIATGPILMGMLSTLSGTYSWSYLAAGFSSAIAIGIFLLYSPTRK